jgi:very-short-patch-repair endonuclease
MPHDEVSDAKRAHAKQLRRTMTRAETLLWRHLKANRLCGLGFRRQGPMGNYIADFVSHACKLVIEVDGESHDFEERIRHDEVRDQWFASRGYRVLRFTNDDVMKNLEGVVIAIGLAAEQAAPPSLTLPRKGGGNASIDGSCETSNDTGGEVVIALVKSVAPSLPPPLRERVGERGSRESPCQRSYTCANNDRSRGWSISCP